MPNPLRCFNCQRLGHHENNCPVDLGSVCANCGAGGHDHHTSACKNKPKCVNCGKEHVSRSNQCEIWKKEKEIMKIKTTKNITYLEAKKLFDSQSTDLDFSKIVHSLSSKPETKTTGTQFFEEDFVIHTNTRVVIPSVRLQCHIQMFNLTQMQGLVQIQRLGHILSLVLSQVLSLVLSQVLSLVLSQVLSLVLSRNHKKGKE